MIRVLSRLYGTRRANPHLKTGCRLLDYVSPATHAVVPRTKFLLGSRTGNRYQNQTHYWDEQKELMTLWAFLRRRARRGLENPPHWHKLRERLGLDPATTPSHRLTQEAGAQHLNTWVDCIDAPDISRALSIIMSHASIEWPPFIVLHTFGRHGRTPLNVYNAMRAYEILLPRMPHHIQPELVAQMLRLAQKHLIDLVPFIVRMYLDLLKSPGTSKTSNAEGSSELSEPILNELLWQVARYGKHWSHIDVPLLSEAQEMLVRFAGTDKVDAKGMFALTYVTHFTKPELAREFMENMKSVMALRTRPENAKEFAYTNGPDAIKLLTSPTAEQALAVIDHVSANSPAMWTCAALYLKRKKFLTPSVAMRLWDKCIEKQVRITNLLTELVISAQHTFSRKSVVLSRALAAGLRLTPSLVAKMASVGSKLDLETVASRYPEFMNHPLVLESLIVSQCHCDPAVVWRTYTRLYGEHSDLIPSRKTLAMLCRAAWDSTLLWDGMYASQRALAEVKRYVRGAAAPADDILRIYPDEKLLYAYIVLLGRSGYHHELITFLAWMDDLNFEPTKRMLLALIHYSPQGPALLELGQKTRPPASNWPTREEYEVYKQML